MIFEAEEHLVVILEGSMSTEGVLTEVVVVTDGGDVLCGSTNVPWQVLRYAKIHGGTST